MSAPSKAATSGLFGDGDNDIDDGEDELFGSKPETGDTWSKKKPAGGVSLFGGADPFGKGKQSLDSDPLFGDNGSDDTPSINKEPAKAAPTKSAPIKQVQSQSSGGQKSGKGLFSESDDDDNDLFSTKVPVSKPKLAEAKVTDTKHTAVKQFVASKGLFSDSESEGEDVSVPANQPPKVVKQPSGTGQPSKGLFSDSDDNDQLFSAPKEKVAASKTENSISATQAPAKQGTSKGLFDESDGDESMVAPHSNTVTTARSVSGTKQQSTDRPSAMPTSTKGLFSESDEEENVLPQPTANNKPVASTVTTKPTSGLFSDSDDDDLFSGKDNKAAKAVKSSENISSAKVDSAEKKPVFESPLGGDIGKATKKSAEPAPSLFASASDDDDMFGSSKPTASEKLDGTAAPNVKEEVEESKQEHEDTKPPEPVKPKRPAGAVSMFGGMDPTALLKKKATTPSATNKAAPKPNRKSIPATSLFDSDSSDDDLFSSKATRKPPPRRKESKAVPEPVSKPASSVSKSESVDPLQSSASATAKSPPVKKLTANIAFNPLAMMPGAAPPKKEPPPAAVGFDTPAANTNVLHSMNKSRARVQQKRKPPSRHVRGKQSTPATDSVDTSVPSTSAAPEINNQFVDRVPEVNPLIASTNHDTNHDTNSVSHNIDASRKDIFKVNDSFLEDSDSDELFGSKVSPSVEKITPTNIDPDAPQTSGSKESNTADQVSVSPTPDLPSKSPSAKDPFADDSDDDDFFTKPSSKHTNEKENTDALRNGQSNETDTFGGEFSQDTGKLSSPVHEQPPPIHDDHIPPTLSTSKDADAFALDDSDDDMFSSKKARKSKQKVVADIFDDDDDTLFGSSKTTKKKSILDDLDDDDLFSTKPTKTRKQKPFTKDADLFGDDDIFADIPIKSKEKKSRSSGAVKKPNASKKSAVDDDMDDLFADLGTKKSKTKKLDLNDDDLFGDPLGGLK